MAYVGGGFRCESESCPALLTTWSKAELGECVNEKGWAVAPCGAGTCLPWCYIGLS